MFEYLLNPNLINVFRYIKRDSLESVFSGFSQHDEDKQSNFSIERE